MPAIPPSRLIALQSTPQNIRNICILAHVDHGKTSLTDSLIATNGIISPKMAGKIRYLDSRPDEQTRGITMESSAISLHFSMMRRRQQQQQQPQEEQQEQKEAAADSDTEWQKDDYLINLIDSPGHIDFSSEVSTASRLCDAAVVLVDAVEGVCPQTVTVLRQVWIEKLKPLLVINKIDRLVTELKMSPTEAYSHLGRLLEGVNAVIGGFFQGERMEEDMLWREREEQKKKEKNGDAEAEGKPRPRKVSVSNSAGRGGGGSVNSSDGVSSLEQEFEELDDEDLYFAPEKSNVIFASAIDGWAFTVRQFAGIYEKKLGINRSILEKVLWGDFYLDPKTKKVLGQKHLKGRNLKPIFVQLVLEPIWTVYEATVGGTGGGGGGKIKGDPQLLEKVTKSLSITLPPHVLRSRDPKAVLQSIFSSWLPLSTAVLVSVIEYLPSPPDAQAARLPEMIDELVGAKSIDPGVKDAMVRFQTDKSAPVVAYVSKMVAIPESELPSKKRSATLTPEEARELARRKHVEIAKAQALPQPQAEAEANGTGSVDGISLGVGRTRIGEEEGKGLQEEADTTPEDLEDPEHLIGFARLYSGTLSVGDEVYVLPPKFNPAYPHASPEPRKVPITALYLLMGRALEPLESVSAGVIFGVEGLEGHILKTGTLCSQLEGGINLAGVTSLGQPIVRVALEPVNPMDLNKMIRGLKLLEKSDPCAVYEQMESGEHVILTAGELHLERCLKDLRERFARCDVQPGEPIVPYRETIVEAEEMEPPKNSKGLPRGTVVALTSSKSLSVRLMVRPLPINVTEFLIKHGRSIRKLYAEQQEEGNLAAPTGRNRTHEDEEKEARSALVGSDTNQQEERRHALSAVDFRSQLQAAFDEARDEQDVWHDVVARIVAFGPRRVGPNVFIDATDANMCKRFLMEAHDEVMNISAASEFSDTVSYAFQLAAAQGPLCREPMQGVAVFLEKISHKQQLGQLPSGPGGAVSASASTSVSVSTSVSPSRSPSPSPDLIATSPAGAPPATVTTATTATDSNAGRLTGELITVVRNSISTGFLDWSPRILLAMYTCTIQATPEVLGRVSSVLTRRRGSILSESLLEGTPYFTITARLPVAESFGLSDEIRKRTSGLAPQPVLRFAGFDLIDEIDQDPYWVPRSEEELEDLGIFAERENLAKKYVDAVRKRKGLLIKAPRGRAGGRDAEKQKTLKTN